MQNVFQKISSKKFPFLNLTLVTCFLGNFVDMYDLTLFGAVRVSSLNSLGLSEAQVLESGILLLNAQFVGMVLGGVISGIIGDKLGRIALLCGSVILYSSANLANGFVQSVPQYVICRFFAGLGLAGELGACITILLEILPAGIRGYGTMALMIMGHIGAVFASYITKYVGWRMSFWIGGFMGFVILFLRLKAEESALFQKASSENISRGNVLILFKSWKNLIKYSACVFASTPPWFCYGILMVFAPEIALSVGIQEPAKSTTALSLHFGAMILGDLAAGFSSHWFKTRKKIILFYILGTLVSCLALWIPHLTLFSFYAILAILGFFSAYTVVSYTLAAEQFGTNIRATVATSTPNFVRASAIVFTSAFGILKESVGALMAASYIGGFCLLLAFVCAFFMQETFGKSLDFLET